MSPQKRASLENAKWEEWDKKRNSHRFKMLQLLDEVELTKECITQHEKIGSQDKLSERAQKLNEDIITTLRSHLKLLLKKASNL